MFRSRTFAIGLGALAALFAATTWGIDVVRAGATKSRNFEVRMTTDKDGNFVFDQKAFEIQVGDTVSWINTTGAKHTVTPAADSPVKFTKAVVNPGKVSDRILFGTDGMVKYFCEIHPDMTGTITVKKAP